ncbi:bone morphogenetic protein 1-like [Anneissia japonica]|uniref:bone morphogenetic protein 1-like n=1 Tax=Anneissia japonica TaxID=1529436 RepID=UPI001425B234|nr:bone morphogenetic protein 1-like [Anneissia japonica]
MTLGYMKDEIGLHVINAMLNIPMVWKAESAKIMTGQMSVTPGGLLLFIYFLNRFCGQTLPDDLSFTEDVVVEFTTDNVYEWTGFALNYVVLESEADDWNEWSEWSECSATCGTGSISRTRTCSGSYCLGLGLQETSCGDLSPCENRCEPAMTHTQNSNGGRIKSPGYPFQYPKKYFINRKVYCNITIDVPADKSVTFSFNDLDFTCCDYDCIFDRLVFIYDNEKTKVCRNDVSTTLEYGSGTVTVIFRTVNRDYGGIYSRGFDMLYTFE